MDVKEKLEVIAHLGEHITYKEDIGICYDSALAKVIEDAYMTRKKAYMTLKNGVTVQEDVTELIGKGLDNIYWRIYGSNKEFNERMAGYNPSAFCAGFEYAIQLAKGLLTQLPQPPKGE